jgi:hypothetical protein
MVGSAEPARARDAGSQFSGQMPERDLFWRTRTWRRLHELLADLA